MQEKRKMSIKDKVDYLPAFLSIGGTAIAAPVTGLVRGPEGADTYRHHVTNALIRKFNSRLNSLQSQAIQPSFDFTYEKWCRNNNQKPDFVKGTGLGVRGFWMGDKERAKHVIVYFHGGGFALPGSEGHLNFWGNIQSYLSEHSCEIAFFFVTYTLTPHATYPKQLEEGLNAVQYLIEKYNRTPSELCLGGDSAGGNLALAILLHMSEPCHDIENKFTIKENFRALILMAPWVSFDTEWPSFKANRHKDYIEAAVEGRWSAEYLGVQPKPRAAEREITTGNPDTRADSWYAEPGNAPAEAWADSKCDKILVVYGNREALSDPIEEWVEKYKQGIGEERVRSGGIEVSAGQSEVHIAPIVWPMFGDKKETESGATLKKWMLQNLS